MGTGGDSRLRGNDVDTRGMTGATHGNDGRAEWGVVWYTGEVRGGVQGV